MNNKKEKYQPVQVFVRVRPMNKQERAAGNTNVVDVRSVKEIAVKNSASEKYQRNFVYEKVFGPDSQQIDVYSHVAEPMVAEVLAGYNCTVFAYGQTGTGKTYTMAGGAPSDNKAQLQSWQEDPHAGIIPRTLAHLFDELRVRQSDASVLISYLELYNEEIFDLLSPVEDNTKLKLYDDVTKKGSVIVQNLTEVSVTNKNQVYKILHQGAEKRKTAATLMNSQSSRSHSVFCVTVHVKESTESGEDLLKTGKLYLVDLAGSENIKMSGATDKRAREACNINQSLLTLGRCITALAERRSHVPYRESKLSRLLQDSLGGRTKTSLIATVSPAFSNLDETLNTLDYASRARNITNKPEVNQTLTGKQIMKEYADQIERLRKDLQATRLGQGIFVDPENYDKLLKDLEIQRDEISEKIQCIRVLKDEVKKLDSLCAELHINLHTAQQHLEEKEHTITKLETDIEHKVKTITNLEEEKEQKNFIIEKQKETEKSLQNTAKSVIKVAVASTTDIEKLHSKLDTLAHIEKHNKNIREKQLKKAFDKYNTTFGMFESFKRQQCDYITSLHEKNDSYCELVNNYFQQRGKTFDLHDRARHTLKDAISNILQQINRMESVKSDAKKEINDLVKDYIKHTDDVFNGQLMNRFSKMFEFVDQMMTYMKDYHENSVLKQREFVETSSNTAAKVEATISLLDADNEKLSTANYHLNRTITKNLDCVLSLQNLQKSMNATLLKNIAAATENHDTLQATSKLIASTRTNLHETRSDLSADNESWLKSCQRFSDDCTARAKRNCAGLDSMYEDAYNTAHDALESFKNIKEIDGESLVGLGKRAIERIDGDIIAPTCDYYLSLNNQLDEVDSCLADLRVSEDALASDLVVTVQNRVAECTEVLQQEDQHVQRGFAMAASELDTQRAALVYLQTNHEEYRPSGGTPVRTSYKLPTTLPATAPLPELIDEFFKAKSMPRDKENEQNNDADT